MGPAAKSENAAESMPMPSPVGTRLRAASKPPVRSAQNPTPRRLRGILALHDFDEAARRHLPRMVYGFVAGAAETQSAFRATAESFGDLAFVPRTMMDVSQRSAACCFWGRDWAAPVGISPFGGAAMVAYRGDIALASAARDADIPMILSASSLISLEEVHAANPHAWFQAYLPGDMSRIEPLVRRAAKAGYETLVVTADHPVPANRENNVRDGFSMPLRITPRNALSSAIRPGWLFGTIARTFLSHGMPRFENMDAEQGPPMFSQTAVRNINSRDQLAWSHVEEIRRIWQGRLVIKGLLSPTDVAKARSIGADGVIVSSHGGRQLDYAVAPLRMLPEIRDTAGDMAVMIDGGFRRGTDVLKALALGADFVFVGRPFLFAAAVGGQAGVSHAIRLLIEEIERDMALLGVRRTDEVTPDLLRPARSFRLTQ